MICVWTCWGQQISTCPIHNRDSYPLGTRTAEIVSFPFPWLLYLTVERTNPRAKSVNQTPLLNVQNRRHKGNWNTSFTPSS